MIHLERYQGVDILAVHILAAVLWNLYVHVSARDQEQKSGGNPGHITREKTQVSFQTGSSRTSTYKARVLLARLNPTLVAKT